MNIALVGYGVVGGGVHALLKDGALGIHVRRVLDMRDIPDIKDLLTDNIADIIGDPTIDCVVEAIGGLYPALGYVASALRMGKHVVTSNKEMISHGLAPLLEGAGTHKAKLRFSASTGGGIPWIHNLMRLRRGDRILSVYGIVNGTTNYILDAMAGGLPFDTALSDAQRMGYAEADASADLDGLDTQRKCAISASLAFDAVIEAGTIPTLGIAAIRKVDIQAFQANGLTCKLYMHGEKGPEGICAYVEPVLLPGDIPAAHVPTNHNYISLCGEQSGVLSFFGQGAGRYPTAENIVQDLLDIKGGYALGLRPMAPVTLNNEAEVHPYYIRTACPEAVSGLSEKPLGGGLLTKPMSVAALHQLAKTIREKDPDAFFAGLPEYSL